MSLDFVVKPFDDRLRDARAAVDAFEAASRRYTNCRDNRNGGRDHNHDGSSDSYPCPHRAAVKRASMDLTRALAVLRR